MDDSAVEEHALAGIFAILLHRTGLDFSIYRRPTVIRRIRNRMLSIPVESMSEYLERLHRDPAEAVQLAERIAIKVSRFYRNRATFDLLLRDVLPHLAGTRRAPLRLWSAGCGCGEEAYTLAMLLAETGIDGSVDASDIDETALAKAAAGVFAAETMAELPDGWTGRYFALNPAGPHRAFRVSHAIRARVRFFRHDVTTSRGLDAAPCYDLVACRNVLIYLQPAAQQQALETILASVARGGVVCLGEAEWPPPALAGRLDPIDARGRVFRATPSAVQEVRS
jgi:chemotaxis methyl-accepting protein methylase